MSDAITRSRFLHLCQRCTDLQQPAYSSYSFQAAYVDVMYMGLHIMHVGLHAHQFVRTVLMVVSITGTSLCTAHTPRRMNTLNRENAA